MQTVTVSNSKPIEPHCLGPLDDQSRLGAETGTLFSGAERFLGRGEIKRRTALWNSLAERIERLCGPDEHVLYVAPAIEKTGIMHYMALGALVQKYHQVALVITDTRVLEFLLEYDGKKLSERARSYSWSQVAEAKLSFGKLVLKPVDGKPVAWHLRKRGDRKLLKLLLPKLNERLHSNRASADQTWAASLCSACGAQLPDKPKQCDSCGTLLRSPGLAATLSLAFPGAGLLYAGHPVLATLDFLGEAIIFVVVASMLLVANNEADVAGALVAGMILLGLTKLESVHVGSVLASRRRTDSPERRARWRRGAMAGGAVSVLALVVAIAGTGLMANGIDRDLDVSDGESAWLGSRDAADWELFVDDPDMRSQWHHEDGWIASVFAYPLDPGQTPETFHQSFVETEHQLGADVLLDDDSLPNGFRGFRIVEQVDSGEEPIVVVHYFVHDPQGDDIHQVLLAAAVDSATEAEYAMRDLLTRANWVDAVAPTP
jgi:hypothetical protein